MNRIHIWVVAGLVAALVHGCCSERCSAVPMVRDVGADVATKNRYRLSGVYCGVYSEETLKAVRVDGRFLERFYPNVFSSNGQPIVLRILYDRMDTANEWTELLGMCTIGLIPGVPRHMNYYKCSVELADEAAGKSAFELMYRVDSASTWLPTAFLFCNGDVQVDGCRVFSRNTHRVGGEKGASYKYLDYDSATHLTGDAVYQRALAYALAVKLKELEDSGKAGTAPGKRAADRPAAPPHRVVRLDREQGSSYSYSFAIELDQVPANASDAALRVLSEFMDSVTEDYLDSHPGSTSRSLTIDFSDMKMEGTRISGRATVLTIAPVSLSYDADTRRGKLSVRFGAGQEKEARAWIAKNLKTLARDKNIALTTGQRPPEGTCHLLEVRVDGNVMEVEFKTE